MIVAVTVSQVWTFVGQFAGLAILAGTVAAVGAFAYRWYVDEALPSALGLLLGLGAVAVYLNTTTALEQVIGGVSAPTETEVALFNIAAFLVGAGGATVGQRAGDTFQSTVSFAGGHPDRVAEVSRLVRTLGRATEIELPEEIDDVVGYDPVSAETKAAIAGSRFVFPQQLSAPELRSRLSTRLKTDFAVGHVDADVRADGTVEYLAVGSRAAGIGATLPPATNAVAVRADPAFAASAGDLVQVWETGPERRVVTAELRGVSDDVVTLAIDAADTPKLDSETEYRLVTLPIESRPDREFAALLRAAEETFSSVTVEAGSSLHGLPVGALSVTVVAVTPAGESAVPLPARDYRLAPGAIVFAIARPDALRRLETAARPVPPSLASDGQPPPLASRTETASVHQDAAPVTEAATPVTTVDGTTADGDEDPAGPVDRDSSMDDNATDGADVSAPETGGDATDAPAGPSDDQPVADEDDRREE